MTTEERIQWVLLPAGTIDEETLRLSVVVAPRLRSDACDTLADYPDFVDWPEVVRGTSWAVAVGGDVDAAVPAEVIGPAPDSTLWAALFPPDTTVTRYEFDDYADRPMVTFGVGQVADSLRRLYAVTAAASPGGLPRRRTEWRVEPHTPGLDELLREVGSVLDSHWWRAPTGERGGVAALLADARQRAHARRTGPQRGQPSIVEPLPPGGPEFARALFFHSRPGAEPVEMPEDGGHYRQTVDFHQSVSALGDHPALLRRLGLVVDLRVPRDALPPAPAGSPRAVRVMPTLPELPDLSATVSRVPVTHDTAYVLVEVPEEGTVFAAAPRVVDPAGPEGGVPTGLAALPETAFRLEQLDVDGAAIKAIHLAANIYLAASGEAEQPLHQPDSAGLPALRSSALALVQSGRALALQGDFARSLDLNAATEAGVPALLHAEDVVLGHRLDVFDANTGRWHSTTARTETVTAQRFDGDLPPDSGEGFSQLGLAGAATAPGAAPDPDGELYVHETVLSWDGWSLAAPRPGASLSRDPRAPDPEVPESQPSRVANDPQTSVGLSFTARATPGTLPRLRFGRSYRVRLRSVDLAGNGTNMADADRWLASAAASTPALPAQTSTPYLRFEPVPAPAVVPATGYGEGASLLRLVVRSNAEGVAAWTAAFNAAHAQDQPEPHTPYDVQDQRHLAPPKAAFDLAERHGMFDPVIGGDGAPDQAATQRIAAAYEVARREKGSFDDATIEGADVVDIPAAPPTLEAGPQGHRAAPQRYVIHRAAQLELPYLPDPLALGVVLFGLPGRTDPEPLRIGFDGPDWHARRPMRLHLADGAGEPAWDADARVLTVHLPAAGRATVRVASALDALDLMAMRDWCERELTGADLDDAIRAMKENRSWLTTPWHTVELVHAVQQPLGQPEVLRFGVFRETGSPAARLAGEVVADLASTEQIDLLARWTEPVDDPVDGSPPHERSAATAVFELAVATASLVPTSTPGEEAYALVEGKVVAFNTAMQSRDGLPPGPVSHHFGDTKHRLVTYTVRATTAFREYFPVTWMGQPERLSRDSEPIPVHVPASAPPAVPAVLYAVPTLRWEDRGTDDAVVSVRGGGGLRVWLDRGWWSSGAGEQLGVVIGPYLSDPSEAVHHLMTFVGQDMTRAGGKVASPDEHSFPNCADVVDGITLQEAPTRVRLALFEPEYDPGTARWFCDIDVDTGTAYLPVLRLALVRYQPHALPGCSVSRVVLVDIVQTLPDRTLTVARAEGTSSVAVTVAGPSYTGLAGPGGPRTDEAVLARVSCRVQRRPSAGEAGEVGQELAWLDVDGAATVLTASFDGPVATWTGRIEVAPATDGTRQRLLVVEVDRVPVDEQTASEGGLVDRVVYAASVAV